MSTVQPLFNSEGVEALREYLSHGQECTWWKVYPLNQEPCSCGLEDALATYTKAIERAAESRLEANEARMREVHDLAWADATAEAEASLRPLLEAAQAALSLIEKGETRRGMWSIASEWESDALYARTLLTAALPVQPLEGGEK